MLVNYQELIMGKQKLFVPSIITKTHFSSTYLKSVLNTFHKTLLGI